MCRRLMIVLWILHNFKQVIPQYEGEELEMVELPTCTKKMDSMAMLLHNTSSYYVWIEDPCVGEDVDHHSDQYLSTEEDQCQPKCNLILHQKGCVDTDAGGTLESMSDEGPSWNGQLCPTEPAVGCSLVDRFACTTYDISPVMYAMKLCEEEGEYIRNCSTKFGCHNQHMHAVPYAVHSTDQINTCQQIKSAYNRSTELYDQVPPWLYYFSLPINQLDVNSWMNRVTNDSWPAKSDFYIRTAAVHPYVFESLQSSLFYPYRILLKEFAPCMEGLSKHHRLVLLYLANDGYLIEFGNTNSSSDNFAVCTLGGDDHLLYIRFILLNVTTCLSMFGLLATVISMFVSKEHLNIPGVNLMNLCGCLMAIYVTVMLANLIRQFDDECIPEGVIHVLAVLSSVMWMNVMAFDIWHNLSRIYPMEARFSWRNRSKWLGYWAYAWLCPMILCGVGCLADQMAAVPKWFKPHYTIRCWFFEFNTWGTVFFYHGPIGIIMSANLVLFLLTAKLLYYSQQHRQRYSVCGAPATLRNLFQLYLKLFLVLGLTWALEIANMLTAHAELIIASDFINSLQGFFLFLIFVCKPKVFRAFCSCLFGRRRSIKKLNLRQHSNSSTSRLSMTVLPSSPTSANCNYTLRKNSTQQSTVGDLRV